MADLVAYHSPGVLNLHLNTSHDPVGPRGRVGQPDVLNRQHVIGCNRYLKYS